MAQRTERSRFRIGELLVHPDRLVIIRDGEDVHVEPMWMDLLVYLAENRDRTIGTQQLLGEVWGHTHREEGAVQKVISLLRSKVFLESSRKPRYIENIRGQGYRLIAPVAFPNDYISSRGNACTWTDGSPYVGLAAFDEAHAGVFFGRGDAIARVMAAMRAQRENGRRLVLLVGASGSGKTSLLRAGVVPRLVRNGGEDGLRALSVARCDLGTAPGGDPLAALAAALATWTLAGRPVLPPQPTESLRRTLVGQPRSLHAQIDEAFRRFPERIDAEPHAHLLLTLDHAEGLVAVGEDDPARHDAFARVVETLCEHPRVLATMVVRGDFYPKLMEAVPALVERKGSLGHVDVARPTAIEINDIITLPAISAGLEFERDPGTHAVHYLNHTLAEAARGQADVLPLLQHTLHELHKRCDAGKVLTYAAYREIGELEGAIARRAEAVFASLPEDARRSLDVVLGQLVVVDPESGAARGRRAAWDALPATAAPLVQAFLDARLFASALDEGRARYGVAHEALLRQWPRARQWVEENKRLLQAGQRLHDARKRWLAHGKQRDFLLNAGMPLAEALQVAKALPQTLDADAREFIAASKRLGERRRRLAQGAAVVLAAMALVSATLAAMAIDARNDANARRRDAQSVTGFMLVDLDEAAGVLDDLSLPDRMSGKVISDCTTSRRPEPDAQDLVNCSRAYRIRGRVLYAQGHRAAAESQFETAAAMAERASRIDPASQEAINERGQCDFWKGLIHYDANRFGIARAHWTSYLHHATRLLAMAPDNPKWMFEVSFAATNLGIIEKRRGHARNAIRLFEASAQAKRSALVLLPYNESYYQQYLDTLSWISSTQEDQGHLDEASLGYETQIRALRTLIRGHPGADSWKLRLANYLQLDANLQLDRGELQRAQDSALESIDLLQALNSRHAEHSKWKVELARGHLILADVLRARGALAAASDEVDRAAARLADAPRQLRGELPWRRLDIVVRFLESRRTTDGWRPEAARLALHDMAKLLESNPGDEIGMDLVRMLAMHAEDLESVHLIGEARSMHREALRVLDRLSCRQAHRWIHAHAGSVAALERLG